MNCREPAVPARFTFSLFVPADCVSRRTKHLHCCPDFFLELEFRASMDLVYHKNGDVHVWCFRNDRQEAAERCQAHLSAEERARAARFRRVEDRCAYITTRGVLRELLAVEVGCAPRDIEIVGGDGKKPALNGAHQLYFNVSHTAGLSLVAVSRAREVGVDIERIDLRVEALELAERFFHSDERLFLGRLPPSQRCDAFFDLWVRKEALHKAIGFGLRLELSRYALHKPGTSTLVAFSSNTAAVEWLVEDLMVPPGYRAAVAFAGAPGPLTAEIEAARAT